jgi:hypothetical protein
MNDVIASCKYHQHQGDRQMAMTPESGRLLFAVLFHEHRRNWLAIGRPSADLLGTLTVAVT